MAVANGHEKLAISSPAFGLLAVLAVSGSVVLLTIGKHKLLSHVRGLAAGDVSSPPCPDGGTQSSSSHVSSRPCPDVHMPSSSSGDEKKQRCAVKKVRFAPDVVEPTGDGRAFRNKVMYNIAMKKGKQRNCEMPERNQSASSSGLSELSGQPIKKVGVLAEPKLPANRMALYKGMQRYRSMMALDCM